MPVHDILTILSDTGTALLCGFRVAQAGASREDRRQQESQTHVANLVTLFLDLASVQTPFGDFNYQKQLLTKLVTFSALWQNVGINNKF